MSQSSFETPCIFIVDDDVAVRRSLEFLVVSFGYEAKCYATGEEFFHLYDKRQHGCLLLDIRMEGWSGLELQKRLMAAEVQVPIIFISAEVDVPIASEAFRAGAVDVLEKPVEREVLLKRIEQALKQDWRRLEAETQTAVVSTLASELTERERDVKQLMIDGNSIKQIASNLGVSHQTAAKHRSRVLDKMRVDNEVELLKLVTGE